LDISQTGLPDIKEVLDVGYVNTTSNKRRRRDIKKHYLGENKWPSVSGRDLENAIDNYAESNAELAQVVLQLLSEGLTGTGDIFDQTFGSDALQVQRLTWYPATAELADRRQGEIGSGAHTDYGGVTLLHADGPGLQILRPNVSSDQVDTGTFSTELKLPHSEEWLEVESRPGSFIVLAGEALQRLTHGRILAARHKVDSPPHTERHSLAFFLDPRPDAVLKPIPQLTNSHKPEYTAKLAGHKGVIH